MLGWSLILGFLLVVFAGLSLFDEYDDYFIVKWIDFIMLAFTAILVISTIISIPYQITKFEKTKEYVDAHQSVNALEDVSLTNKKIEMNEWLFGAQSAKESFGIFSLYPDSVLELEPIE